MEKKVINKLYEIEALMELQINELKKMKKALRKAREKISDTKPNNLTDKIFAAQVVAKRRARLNTGIEKAHKNEEAKKKK